MNSGLTPEQIGYFHEDGFLIVRDLLAQEALQPLINELEQKVDDAVVEAVEQGWLDSADTFPDASFATRLPLLSTACSKEEWLWEQVQGKHHKTAGIFTLRTWPSLLDEADMPDGEIVTCEVAVGDVLMTMERLLHRSIPNTSNTVRWSVDTRYNRIGLPTGRAHKPGFVARSRENPDSAAKSHHDWIRLFDEAGLDWTERTGGTRRPDRLS